MARFFAEEQAKMDSLQSLLDSASQELETYLEENSGEDGLLNDALNDKDKVTKSGKPVYGLFIANRIDSNTAETFRIGVWFTRTDDKMRLDIIPVTLAQFKAFFEALFTSGRVEVVLIRELLDLCSGLRSAHESPAWKREIAQTINHRISVLMS